MMQNKKLIILIVLGVFAVLSLARGFMSSNKKVKANQEVNVSAEATSPATDVVHHKRSKKTTSVKDYKRNPFVPTGSKIQSSSRVLDGIMWDPNKPKAMINNEIKSVGDKVGSKTIIAIEQDKVILEDEEGQTVLTLE